jgi:hypothetical protein
LETHRVCFLGSKVVTPSLENNDPFALHPSMDACSANGSFLPFEQVSPGDHASALELRRMAITN